MTLLGAVRDADRVLVGADGLLIVTDKRSEGAESLTVQKLYRLGRHSVVWGYVGEDGIGRAMRVFIDSLEITDWPTLTQACGTKIRELNVQAGMFHHPTGVLIVGYLDEDLDCGASMTAATLDLIRMQCSVAGAAFPL